MVIAFGIAVILCAGFAVLRRVDVRLVLILAALALALDVGVAAAVRALVGGPEGEATGALAAFAALGLPLAQIVRTFLATLADEKFVVPICTSMGYAHVLRETGCDKHLVELLVKPLRHFRPLVLPGIVLVGFVVNVPLISQASTAVASGIVLVPLARAAGIAPITIGAALALGCSIGGELLNPGRRSSAASSKPCTTRRPT